MNDRSPDASATRPRLVRLRMAGATLSGRIAAALAAAIALAAAAVVTQAFGATWVQMPMLVGPIGASAVLAFAVPTSPLAQPWSVVGGNSVSALVGWGVAITVPDAALAAGLAVGLAIVAMTLIRALHPPGGATALTAVLLYHDGGGSWLVPLLPIAINSVVLVAVAWAFHRTQRRSYPHRPAPHLPGTADLFHPDDIRAAVADMGDPFDITHRDLEAILERAAHHRSIRARR